MTVYILVFILIFLFFLGLDSLIAKNYYIYNFLVKYKISREVFYKENIEAIGEENPIFTFDMEKFQKESKQARDYLKRVNIENPKYLIDYMGQVRQMNLINNLGYFHVDENVGYSKEIYLKGQDLLDQAIHEYNKKTKIKFLPFYWLVKTKNLKGLEESKSKKKEKTFSYIWIGISSFVLTKVSSILINLLSSYIYDWIK